MADVHDREPRSFNMSRIRSKDTKPELTVRKFLFARGLRYRLHVRKLPGRPDLVLRRYRTVIFVHGCFWHGHENCPYFVVPKTRTKWWIEKIEANRLRDSWATNELNKKGWNVLTIFECELRGQHAKRALSDLLSRITRESKNRIGTPLR